MTHTTVSPMRLSAVARTRRHGATLHLFIDTDRANDLTGVVVTIDDETASRSAESIDDVAPSALAQDY